MDLALNNLQRLICHKTNQIKPNQTKPLTNIISSYKKKKRLCNFFSQIFTHFKEIKSYKFVDSNFIQSLSPFFAARIKKIISYPRKKYGVCRLGRCLLNFFYLLTIPWYLLCLTRKKIKPLIWIIRSCCFFFFLEWGVFTNGPEDLSAIPGCVIPKIFKMVLDTSLLNIQQYKVRIKGKVEQTRERSSALPSTSV